MYQIRGNVSTGFGAARPSLMPRLASLLIIWILLIAGYAVYRFSRPTRHVTAAPLVVNRQVQPAAHNPAGEQDAARHIEEAGATVARAQTRLRSIEGTLRHLLRQADNTRTASAITSVLGSVEMARQELEQSQKEMEFVDSNLKGEKNQ